MAQSSLRCSVPDCDYETTSEGTIRDRIDLLTRHTNVHKSVHVHLMNLYKMVQQPEENIRAFSARLTGTAEMCGMSVKCNTCQLDISYRDEVVKQIIIHGMFNLDIRQRVLSRTKVGELLTLSALVEYIAAEEASVTESHNLQSSASLSHFSQSKYYRDFLVLNMKHNFRS